MGLMGEVDWRFGKRHPFASHPEARGDRAWRDAQLRDLDRRIVAAGRTWRGRSSEWTEPSPVPWWLAQSLAGTAVGSSVGLILVLAGATGWLTAAVGAAFAVGAALALGVVRTRQQTHRQQVGGERHANAGHELDLRTLRSELAGQPLGIGLLDATDQLEPMPLRPFDPGAFGNSDIQA